MSGSRIPNVLGSGGRRPAGRRSLDYTKDSSRDYNASSGLERIQAALLAINSADDERNPPELGVLDGEIRRVKNGRVLLIPASDQTAGHGTVLQAKFWKKELGDLLQTAPRSAK